VCIRIHVLNCHERERPMTEFVTAVRAAGVTHSDPFVGAIAGALSVPLRQVYALLWRAGLLDITD
jgi:hypothetical protein